MIWKKNYKDLKRAQKQTNTLTLWESRKYEIGKRQSTIGYMDSDFTNSHPSPTDCVSKCVNPYNKQKLMTRWKMQKEPYKGTIWNIHGPIICFSMKQYTLTAQIRDEIYYPLKCWRLFLEEDKGWYKGTKGTVRLLYIYIYTSTILNW